MLSSIKNSTNLIANDTMNSSDCNASSANPNTNTNPSSSDDADLSDFIAQLNLAQLAIFEKNGIDQNESSNEITTNSMLHPPSCTTSSSPYFMMSTETEINNNSPLMLNHNQISSSGNNDHTLNNSGAQNAQFSIPHLSKGLAGMDEAFLFNDSSLANLSELTKYSKSPTTIDNLDNSLSDRLPGELSLPGAPQSSGLCSNTGAMMANQSIMPSYLQSSNRFEPKCNANAAFDMQSFSMNCLQSSNSGSANPTNLQWPLSPLVPPRITKPYSMQIRHKFGHLGQGRGQFSSPHGFCLGVEEEIVIADTFNHRICIFDKSGMFKHQFGSQGKEDGQLWYPRKVAIIRTPSPIDGSTIPRYVVCDRGSERSRMQLFSRTGRYIGKITIRYIDIVAGLAITPTGNIVAVDSVSPTVFVILENGDLLKWFDCAAYMREPSDIAICASNYYICDFKGHCVVVFNEDGQFLGRIGDDKITNYPNGIDILDNGNVFVGDSHGNRFHVVAFDKHGKLLCEFECLNAKVSRCCGLKITRDGHIVTLAKNNHHVLILNTPFISGNQSSTNTITSQMSESDGTPTTVSQTSLATSLGNIFGKELDFSDLMTRFNLTQLAMCDTAAQHKASHFNSLPTSNDGPSSMYSSKSGNGGCISSNSNSAIVVDTGADPSSLDLTGVTLDHMYSGSENRSSSAKFVDFGASSSTALAGNGDNSNNECASSSSSSGPPVGTPRSLIMSSKSDKPTVMQIRCKFGHLGSNKGQFSSPHGFCLGADEEIVIADTYNHRICIFDKNGEFKFQFGIAGKEDGELWHPRKVAVIRSNGGTAAESRFVVCDRGNEKSRMQIFSRSGQFVRKIGIRYIDIVAGLAITPAGHIAAVDSVSPTVFVISEMGDLLKWFDCSQRMREPSDIAVHGDMYYICDFKGHCVTIFDSDGQYVRSIGHGRYTRFPNGIDISDFGDILVGDSHGNRFHVVVFDKTGKLLSEFECPYVKVSRCCGLKITSEGYVVTLAKNNHHVLVLNTLYIV